jgi:LPXTG-site transpeptidase (sortase) family protein
VPFDGHTWLIEGLREEVAWMGDTSWPGLGGNTGLAGHVTVRDYGDGPFRYVSNLVKGDTVILYTDENVYTYVVSGKSTVEMTDFRVLEHRDMSQVTLITCVDWHEQWEVYLKRLVVVADLSSVEPIPSTAGY